MNAQRTIALGGLLLAVAVHAGAAAERPWEDYGVLIERNIFSRSRGPARRQGEQPAERSAPRPEQYLYLRGIVRTDGDCVAVVEDMRSGRLTRARAGERLLDGEVGEVTLDGMSYVREAQTAMVAIGENLARSKAPPPAETTEGGAPAAEPPAGQGGDVLEMLRQRRLRELGQ